MAVWVIGDPKLGLLGVAENRGFQEPISMLKSFKEHWQETIPAGDLVYVVGELGTLDLFESLSHKLNGRKKYVGEPLWHNHGNHWYDIVSSVTILETMAGNTADFLLGDICSDKLPPSSVRLVSEPLYTETDMCHSCWYAGQWRFWNTESLMVAHLGITDGILVFE